MSHLYYIHDPMCSWCWGFRPTLEALLTALPGALSYSRLLGGLAADSSSPMPEEMRIRLQATWREIERRIPNTGFNFDFWSRNTPRRSTYPACRAVIAARILDPGAEEKMILAIQQAYYLEARNPSDDSTLGELAREIGLDEQRFNELLNHQATQQKLETEIAETLRLGVRSFPSLVLQLGQGMWPVAVDYLTPEPMLEQIRNILDA
ncbi:MAG: DsbA family protein [gamma proteobacterium symbiont of Ctena orbiculata]|uniref:DsbA family protein n=1 Tax=Candidatus Thiodiazotropha taylori TaxID=2792791 RepID=A0A944QRR7_9GAMM|nr:DsbA family protein [Candidatus Thiodiazotropha taylori]PUB85600.1 MAG: DsbA family protein [gamma proteobacterium symbiont of Ctena orbiculata]MBT2988068.1 DsbA family protein [Candidatus Thiodiazotropha taylori]MBT2998831.1 DsbA family protein [Candidatus Thiodiazotropha taylori]MBT3002190.1 DsbA family protein [Candidatus Thiodiazotropha taylori]